MGENGDGDAEAVTRQDLIQFRDFFAWPVEESYLRLPVISPPGNLATNHLATNHLATKQPPRHQPLE